MIEVGGGVAMAERPPKRPKRLAVPGSQARIELPAPEMERVREVARRNGLSLSAAIRQAVAFWVAEMERRIGARPDLPPAVYEPMRPAVQEPARPGDSEAMRPPARTRKASIEVHREAAQTLRRQGHTEHEIAGRLGISESSVHRLVRDVKVEGKP
jgi:DNA-binding CsgD family transcriptional regulator